MSKKNLRNKIWLVVVFSFVLLVYSQEAFAWGGAKRSNHGRQEVFGVRGRTYHYRDGRFYRPGFFGLFVVVPPIGAVIKIIPAGHRTIITGAITYHYYDNVYYKACPSGYVVVEKPLIVSPQTLTGEKVTINVPNSNGSYTPVMLVKNNNGYVGPQGEYYPGHPTIEQLRALYGK